MGKKTDNTFPTPEYCIHEKAWYSDHNVFTDGSKILKDRGCGVS